ncbi:Adenosylmethionine-8-amino-7-oxononanoate aminotransferase [Kordia antarctica]|uniref:Adenosylmethionine-8-amino-7-oxononanoate aminotransferase n=1 Tax=Kordia antarctica TaxID=1218801 RepID=A0A7L4ZPV8_9FLAO|nr:adenosylmethionine--8-amino-7-oxononanoate transaminase [Kordia antarctica]QHI37904.1 Adenosylmethionine-8-amino-7-oxononanoate aminotransferase [Kordia antarctica]
MSLQERDKKHLWHPLTQHKSHPNHIAITKAKGAVLYDENGNEYIDGIASWYTCVYGHCNPYIIQKVREQMETLDHVVFTGFTHKPAIELSEKLINILPENQEKLFFSDNGSTAIDVAIKMALQYHFNQNEKRTKIIALENGFHGDTFGAMSVSGLSIYNGPFEEFFIDVSRIPVPNGENLDEVKTLFIKLITEHKVAAFIYEPLVQGAAAMQMHKAEHLNEILKIAQEHNVVTIADEVMTGFGKTGKNFASEYIETKPDIICLSKALSAGMVAMAITSCSQKIYDAFYADEMKKGFFHGHTYSGNPVACSAAIAGIDLLQSDEIQANLKRIEASHQAFNQTIKKHPKVLATRQQGQIFALDLNIEMERYGNLRDKLFNSFMSKGVCLRPLGNTIYILAPYITTDAQLQKIYMAIRETIEEL